MERTDQDNINLALWLKEKELLPHMKKTFQIFDSHEDADNFLIDQNRKMSPSERLRLCYSISIHGWKLHHPSDRIVPLRENVQFRIRSLDSTECSEENGMA